MSDETYRVREDIERARLTNAFLSMTMIFYLPEAKNPKRKGSFFLGRDLDNMVQLTQNAVTRYLRIDDVRIIDIHTYKRPLAANERGYVLVVVRALEEYTHEDPLASILSTVTTATTNSIQTSIDQALATIESAMGASESRSTNLEASIDP